MSKCRGYADIEKNIFKKDLIMERKDGLIENKMVKLEELVRLINTGELKLDIKGKIWTDSDINSANLKPE